MLKCREDLVAYRLAAVNAYHAQNKKIIVCAGTGCVSGGSLDIHDKLKQLMEENGLAVSVELMTDPHGEDVGLKKSGCHGFCEMGPLLRIEPQGWLYTKVKLEDCEEIVSKTIIGGECIDRLVYRKDGKIYREQSKIPFYGQQNRVVLEHCGKIDSNSICEYIAIGGYRALEKCLFELSGEV